MWHYSQYLKLCLLWNPEKVTGSTDALLLEIDYLIEKCKTSLFFTRQ